MTCAEIEDLIASGTKSGAVSVHAHWCESCGRFLAAARMLDLALVETRPAPARLSGIVMSAILPKPSYVPEILDFIGWAATIAIAFDVAGRLIATY
jgi:hypothetical protein